jgi:hypothetical protein
MIASPYCPPVRWLDSTATKETQQLQPVTHAQDGNAKFKYVRGTTRSFRLIDRTRPTRKDDSLWFKLTYRGERKIVRMNFAVHAQLTDAAGDQLRVLRTEIEDEYRFEIGRHSGLLSPSFVL